MNKKRAAQYAVIVIAFVACSSFANSIVQDGKKFEIKQHKKSKSYYKALLDTINQEIARVSKSNKKRLDELQEEREQVKRKLDILQRQSERFNL